MRKVLYQIFCISLTLLRPSRALLSVPMIFHRFTAMDTFYCSGELEHITEVLTNRLYFGVTKDNDVVELKNTQHTYYFTIDEELVYLNYYSDFGPLNISCLYKYCMKLKSFLQCAREGKKIVHYTSSDPNKRANAAFLMGSFAIIYLRMQPKQVYSILLNAGGSFRNFVDASQGACKFTIHLIDCLGAIYKASLLNFFDFSDFNCEEYDKNDKLEHGDMNWLVPRKFLAFIGPTDCEIITGHKPAFYVDYFLKNDVKAVIRLNNKVYDAAVFQDAGIEHHELFFPDGTTPPKAILLRFLHISETVVGAIAVHCKAGLGRTGSLIGAYIIKHYRLTARQAIAWMRICRPGSVIGQQQGWLEKIESWLWRQGSHYRVRHYGEGDKIPRHKYGIYSVQWPKDRERFLQLTKRGPGPDEKKRQVQSAQSSSRPGIRYHEFSKKKILQGREEFKGISKMLSRVIPQPHVELKYYSSTESDEQKDDIYKNKIGNSLSMRNVGFKMNNPLFGKLSQKRNRQDTVFNEIGEKKTQGDRLNAIKLLKQRVYKPMNSKSNFTNTSQSGHYSPSVLKRNVGVGF